MLLKSQEFTESETVNSQNWTLFHNQNTNFWDENNIFLKQNNIQKLKRHPSPDCKISNLKGHPEIEMENVFVEEQWVLGISSWPLCSTKLVSCAVHWPVSRYFTEWPMSAAWWGLHDDIIRPRPFRPSVLCSMVSTHVWSTSQRVWGAFLYGV